MTLHYLELLFIFFPEAVRHPGGARGLPAIRESDGFGAWSDLMPCSHHVK